MQVNKLRLRDRLNVTLALAILTAGSVGLGRFLAARASSSALSGRAEVARARGDEEGTIAALRAAVRARPQDAGAGRELVWALGHAGKDEEAGAFLAARPWLYGATALAAGREPAALAAARAAVRRRPGDPAAHVALFEALVGRAQAQTAAMASRCVVCHHREPALSGPAVTRVLFPDRETLLEALAARRAAARLRASSADTRRAGEIYFYLATLYPPRHGEAKAYLVQARRAFEEAARRRPRDTGVWASLGLARLKQGDAAGAEDAWRRALALDPDHEEARINLANLLQSRRRLAEAVSLYAEGLRRLPRSAAVRTNYGVLLWQAGLYREAVAAQQEALRLQPGDPVALLNLGLALKAAGDLPGAEAALRESLRRRPSGAVAHNALGALLAARGNWDGASRAFAEASRCNPGLAAAHANLGRACEHLERWPEAAEAYRRALLWEPGRGDLRARLARITDTPSRRSGLPGH